MDKRVIFAVAGSGKTTYIVNSLTLDKRSLIITYTDTNYINLSIKIAKQFGGIWPSNIKLMTYFQFLLRFCYRPFLSDIIRARGIVYVNNPNRYAKQENIDYYLSPNGYFYSNRLALFLEKHNVVDDIMERIRTYFDVFIIDEIQDIAGRDFNLLEKMIYTDVSMLFVGDFFQHTFDTSRDGNVNNGLFDNLSAYEKRFWSKGIQCDHETLKNSWRCSENVCKFITEKLGIHIYSNRGSNDNTTIRFVSDATEVTQILKSNDIVKLHYQNSARSGVGHRNWGDTKGEDKYNDVCVLLNKTTMKKYSSGKLSELPPATRNKLYVAITRAHGNCYFVKEF